MTPPAQHIVSISGGKDSTATYLLAIMRGKPFRAVWADTGHEHPATVEYIQRLPERAGGPPIERVAARFESQIERKRASVKKKWAESGMPADRIDRALEALTPTGNPFLDLCLWKGRFPSFGAQFCTEELKANPIQDQVLVPAMERGTVIQWLGVRRQESKRRAETPAIRRVRWQDPKSTLIYFYPVRHWSWQNIFALHRHHGVPVNPLYEEGASRVGCWPCINARKSELAMIGRIDPDVIAKLLEWEAMVADASKLGAATFFSADTTPEGAAMSRRGASGTGAERYPDAADVFEWSKTSRGGRQYQMLEPPCASEYGLCE